MKQPDPQRQREFAVSVVKKLREAGFEALWAGGCVRDERLGLVPKDYDVATSATPEQIREVFGRRRTLAVGAAFGVIVVLGPSGAGQIDVATFRQEAGYSDGRHPDQVTFSTPERDAGRRDFTINGLFFDPLEERLIDYVDGQQDLERKIVRAIGDARERFVEDKLRMLRAVRFASTFEFALEEKTLAAVREMAAEVTVVSAERIGAEVRQMLVHATRSTAVELLRTSKLLEVVLPEVAAISTVGADGGPAWRETLRVLAALDAPSFPLALAALLHRSGDSQVAQAVGGRLRMPTKETERTAWLLAHLAAIGEAKNLAWPRLQPLLVSEGIRELLALYEAITTPENEHLAYCRHRLELPPEELNPEPLISGDDLIAHGVRPGESFGLLLARVRDAQLEKEISTAEEALALVDRLLAEGAAKPEN